MNPGRQFWQLDPVVPPSQLRQTPEFGLQGEAVWLLHWHCSQGELATVLKRPGAGVEGQLPQAPPCAAHTGRPRKAQSAVQH
jgi:hypothetical protein